jgi:hypothetical protein
MTDFVKLIRLEENFKEAIAKLPDYKRTACWEYIKALRARSDELKQETERLMEQIHPQHPGLRPSAPVAREAARLMEDLRND